MDRAARYSLLPVFQPWKIWARGFEYTWALPCWGNPDLVEFPFSVACINGDWVLLGLNWNISAVESVHLSTVCMSAWLSTLLMSSLLLYQSWLLSCNCFAFIMHQVVCSVWECQVRYFVICMFSLFLILFTRPWPSWASEMNCMLISGLLLKSCLFVYIVDFPVHGWQKKDLMNVCFFQTLLNHWLYLCLEELLPVVWLALGLLNWIINLLKRWSPSSFPWASKGT